MEVKAVLDTNAVIYLHQGLLAENLPVGEYAILLSYDSFIAESQIVHCKIRYPKRHVGLHPISGNSAS